VGKYDFYEEREAIVSGSVPSVPIESFIETYYTSIAGLTYPKNLLRIN
jgi:hypothetical protein